MLIGGCANPEMSCNVLTYPCVYAISVVGIIVQAINAFTKTASDKKRGYEMKFITEQMAVKNLRRRPCTHLVYDLLCFHAFGGAVFELRFWWRACRAACRKRWIGWAQT